MTNGREKMLIGSEAKQNRRASIKKLVTVVNGNPKWKKAFVQAHPAFDTLEGSNLLRMGTAGRTDDQALLDALNQWIPKVIEEQPEWYKKQNHLMLNK